MAGKENAEPDKQETTGQPVPQPDDPEPPAAEFRMELRDSLPGDRAVIGVEQEGVFVFLASRKYVDDKTAAEFTDLMQRITGRRWWAQHWPDSSS
ncbi:hypothetical protein ACFVAF_37105 [Streptomyces sp. NPDC057596]|uniref:hypothetical protein n=1 Tax=Streptomyces sp. NPDC057596 TaxID=3346178 RepID=UPI0036A1DD84